MLQLCHSVEMNSFLAIHSCVTAFLWQDLVTLLLLTELLQQKFSTTFLLTCCQDIAAGSCGRCVADNIIAAGGNHNLITDCVIAAAEFIHKKITDRVTAAGSCEGHSKDGMGCAWAHWQGRALPVL